MKKGEKKMPEMEFHHCNGCKRALQFAKRIQNSFLRSSLPTLSSLLNNPKLEAEKEMQNERREIKLNEKKITP